jgi:hypothetical protein
MAHVIGPSNVGKHLTSLATSDGFLPLMSSQLGPASQSHATGDGSRPTLSCSRSNKLALEFSKTAKHCEHETTVSRRERVILEATLPIVESLYCWVNGRSFSFYDSRGIDRKNAKALWEGCTFKIEY